MVSFLSFVTLALVGMVAASPLNKRQEREAAVECKDIYQYVAVKESYQEGKMLALMAFEYISIYGTADPLFVNYFGNKDSDVPLSVFEAVTLDDDPSTTLTCSDQCFPGVTTFSSSKTITYCPPFFKQGALKDICALKPIDPGSIRATTTLTELAKTLFDMNDSGYWCDSARWMGANNPEVAVMNSGAYNCFALEVYAKTQC